MNVRYSEKIPNMVCFSCGERRIIHAGIEAMPVVGTVVRVLCTNCGATVTRTPAFLDAAVAAEASSVEPVETTIPGPKTDETDEETEGQPSSDS